MVLLMQQQTTNCSVLSQSGLIYIFIVGLEGFVAAENSQGRTHTHTHAEYDSSGRVISPKQRPLPDSTQHLRTTDIHAPGGIRTLSPRAARGYWRLVTLRS
jgi:hypothetical protein